MAFKLLDRARMSVSGTPGTGNISLGTATVGYQTFAQAGVVNNDQFPYAIVDGNYWEYGIATYIFSGNQISRAVQKTSAQNNTPLNLSGRAVISACVRAEDVAANTTLAGLSDVNIVPGAGIDGQVVYWDNTAGRFQTKTVSGGGSVALSGLSDVNVTEGAPIDGYRLTWNNATSKWIAVAPSAGSTALSALTDVNVTEGSGINGYTLNWNNATSKWVATAPVTPGASTLATLTDVNVTEGAGIDGYCLKWNNATSKWIAGAVSGGSSLTISNNGTAVDTAATTINFVNATSITTSSHNVTVTLPTGSGGGVTAPTIVQVKSFAQNDPEVMAAAPTAGNLLLAVVSHWSAGATTAGWTELINYTSSVNDYLTILYKIATSSDTATLNPRNSTAQSTTIWEIAGASGFGFQVNQRDVSSTSLTLAVSAPKNSLVVGQASTSAGTGVLPTITGATASTGVTVSSGPSGSPRTAQGFSTTPSSSGTLSITAAYASASTTNFAVVVVLGG